MKIFKEIIDTLETKIGFLLLGYGIARMSMGDYKTSSWMLLIVSILFIVGYLAERWSNEK